MLHERLLYHIVDFHIVEFPQLAQACEQKEKREDRSLSPLFVSGTGIDQDLSPPVFLIVPRDHYSILKSLASPLGIETFKLAAFLS